MSQSKINHHAACEACERPLKWETSIETYCGCINPIFHVSCIIGLSACPHCKCPFPSWLIKLVALMNAQRIEVELKEQKEREEETEANRQGIKQLVRFFLNVRKVKIENNFLEFK